MTQLLALGLRFSAVRHLLGRLHWPRPEHLGRMAPEQFETYIRTVGGQADAEAALAQLRGEGHQSQAIASVRGSQSGSS
jgi:hypothetical protein